MQSVWGRLRNAVWRNALCKKFTRQSACGPNKVYLKQRACSLYEIGITTHDISHITRHWCVHQYRTKYCTRIHIVILVRHSNTRTRIYSYNILSINILSYVIIIKFRTWCLLILYYLMIKSLIKFIHRDVGTPWKTARTMTLGVIGETVCRLLLLDSEQSLYFHI